MDYKAKFEPKGDKIIHGAGQNLDMFREYWKAIGKNKPVIYMTYVKMENMDAWVDKMKLPSKEFPNLVLQVGLNFLVDGKDATKEISEGKYEEKFNTFLKVIKDFGNPVFVRAGYEFDKAGKYNPKSFIKAWKYLVDKFRREKISNLATVWCACPYNGTSAVEPFYPGDDYVDWFGVDVFMARHITGKYEPVENFIKLAEKHKKPVMVGESTPTRVGVDKGQESWDEWFKPYFEWISNHDIIKAFCYINWDWSKEWKINDRIKLEWLNGRIHENEIVKGHFTKEMSKSKYIHNQDINEFLKKVYH